MSLSDLEFDDIVLDRFWSKVDIRGTEDCWLWKGGGSPYGNFWADGDQVQTHRFSFSITYGAVLLKEVYVLQRCDNPLCVNPNHLFLGDQKINVEDMVAKDRHQRGERSWRTKLTDSQVIQIRYSYQNGHTLHQLADQFGIDFSAIQSIVKGRNWKHLPGPRTSSDMRCLRSGKKRIYPLVERSCLYCGKLFTISSREPKKYCSLSCGGHYDHSRNPR